MADYWKSTPKYWCKHCQTYVRDTKLERTNHEATAKHQAAVKRALRDLHRAAEQQEKEKERARKEIERLNGVVSGKPSSLSTGLGQKTSAGGTKPSGGIYGVPPATISEAERQRQLEQLAELGVNIPTELRGNMAMAGEWTVTSTKIIEHTPEGEKTNSSEEAASAEGRAVGVKREREQTEEEKEQEEAIKGLFKKPRKWGVDSKAMPTQEDAELEELLKGPLLKTKKEEKKVKEEETEVKKEEDVEDGKDKGEVKAEGSPKVKKEISETVGVDAALKEVEEQKEGAGEPAVVFKKRKAKNIRQK